MDAPDSYTKQGLITSIAGSLCAFMFIGLVGTIVLICMKVDQPSITIISTLTANAMGYVAGLLSSTRTKQVPAPPAAQVVAKEEVKTN